MRGHGNWCGPGWTAGQYKDAKDLTEEDRNVPAIDALDQACKEHDIELADNPEQANEINAKFINTVKGMGVKGALFALAVGIAGPAPAPRTPTIRQTAMARGRERRQDPLQDAITARRDRLREQAIEQRQGRRNQIIERSRQNDPGELAPLPEDDDNDLMEMAAQAGDTTPFDNSPQDSQVPDLSDIMPEQQADEPMEMATMARSGGGGGPNQVAKETPIILAKPTYGLQETHTTILPWTGWITAAGLDKRKPQQLKIRMNTPWDMIDATTSNIGTVDGVNVTTKGLYNRPIDPSGKYSTSQQSRYPVEFTNNTTEATERPAWRDYWSRLYEYYTVLGCEYEIILYNPIQVKDVRLQIAQENNRFVTGPTTITFPAIQQFIDCGYYNSDCVCAVQYDTYSATATSTGNVMPGTNYEEIRAYPGIRWYPVKGGQKAVIKGTYKPGQAKRNVVNDGDVKTWTKTADGVPTSLSEILTLNFFMDPFFNARQQDNYYLNAAGDMSSFEPQSTGANIRGAVNMEINLKYIVQFKDLRQQARYPNTLTTDQDITQILNESIGSSGSALQSWTTATAAF